MLRNTLTANEKYPVWDCVNLSSPIQMQLSLKPTIFSDFFVLFLDGTSNFKHFETQGEPLPTFFRKLQNVKNLVRPLYKKHHSRTPFESQHVKGSQTLIKSSSEHFHHIFSSLSETLILKIPLLVLC